MVSFSSLLMRSLCTGGILGAPTAGYVNWKTFKASGVNLGGWLALEAVIDPTWWSKNCGTAPDEWTCCANLGAQCGPVLERHYATFVTPADIDILASSNVKVLRIPTTYAAWVKVPDSKFYSGNQVSFLNNIASYAIKKYGMHIIVDIHSLPGGLNGRGFGGAEGHFGWFNNATNLDYSYKAVDAALQFIQHSGSPQSYTFEAMNEPVDNPDSAVFGTPAALSDSGAQYVLNYIKNVISRAKAVNAQIPVMFQGSFRPASYWSPQLPAAANLVFDVHNYYFAVRPTDSDTVSNVICSDAKASAAGSTFPVFVGEWSVQTVYHNKFANRRKNVNTGLYAFGKYTQGSAYWTARFFGNQPVDGQGLQGDYWNYQTFINLGYINPPEGAQYCA